MKTKIEILKKHLSPIFNSEEAMEDHMCNKWDEIENAMDEYAAQDAVEFSIWLKANYSANGIDECKERGTDRSYRVEVLYHLFKGNPKPYDEVVKSYVAVEKYLKQNKPLYDLDMSLRLYNVLGNAISTNMTIKDLSNYSMSYLMSLRGFGYSCKKEVELLCESAGLKMKD